MFSYNIIYEGILFNYIYLYVLPKITLLLCFYIDCFYYKQIYLIYNCVFLITFPLILQYLLYCSRLLQEKDTAELEKYFIIEITSEDINYPEEDYDEYGMLKYDYHRLMHHNDPSTIDYDVTPGSTKKYLNIGNFIYYQTYAIKNNNVLYEYNILYKEERKDLYMFFFLEDYERYNSAIAAITLKTHPITKEQCDYLLKIHLYPNALEMSFDRANKYAKRSIININVVLNVLFLCCWCYILIVSIYNLQEDIFSLLMPQEGNPFE